MGKPRTAVGRCCPVVLATPLTEGRARQLAADLAAVADPVRLRLLSLLASAESGEVCVCEMVEPLGRSQPTVSHHLKILVEAGLVVGEKRGRWVWYRAVPEKLARLRGVLA
jgi:ArsR family transcriptional regulator, arsenate/arsenite/antimonite-responsive transcriptional repressor